MDGSLPDRSECNKKASSIRKKKHLLYYILFRRDTGLSSIYLYACARVCMRLGSIITYIREGLCHLENDITNVRRAPHYVGYISHDPLNYRVGKGQDYPGTMIYYI